MKHRNAKGEFCKGKNCSCHRSALRNPGHKRHPGHLGFEGLEARIERTERRKHPGYSAKRIKRIGAGAAANVFRLRVASGKGR